MNPIEKLFLLVAGSVLALAAGSLGAELAGTDHPAGTHHPIVDTYIGWLLLLAGASYPPAAVIYYQRFIKQLRQ
jgi:hypothetical protein